MNPNFAFPRPQPAVPRPALAAKSPWSPDLAGSRESNALRASILDTALELGIGGNSLVADWMFNNPLVEEPEEEEPVPTPDLTYGSPTSVPSSLLHSQYRRDPIVNGNGINFHLIQNVNKTGPLVFHRRDVFAAGSSRFSDADSQSSNVKVHFNPNEAASNVNVSNFQTISSNDSGIAFSDNPIPPRPTTPSGRKLRKKRAGGDGYESDGGYVSESGKKKHQKKDNLGEGRDTKQRAKEERKEEEKKRKKSFIQVINKMSTPNDVQSPTKGYETDGGAVPTSSKSKGKIRKYKTKNSSNEIGYETDGGYQSSSGVKKSKTRFFKLPTRSSKSDLRVDDANGSIPALPSSVEKKRESIIPLPIAERFATTLSPGSTLSYSSSSPMNTEGGGSRMGSPLPALSFQPFAATSELTSTISSPSPVFAGSSAFDRPVTAPTSGSPSAFNANATQLHPKNRDSRSSVISSSSSGSGSNQHHKPQKRIGLFSPLHSPPSSMQDHQQHGLRTTSSLSSLKPSHPIISLPITRATSPTPAGLPRPSLPSHLRSVSPLPPSVSPTTPATSVAPLQINKAQRIKPHFDNLSFSMQQYSSPQGVSPSSGQGSPRVLLTPTVPLSQTPSPGPGFAVVRPRNPPTDGFGPRSALPPNSGSGSTTGSSPIPSPGYTPAAPNSSSSGLSPHPRTQGPPQRISQLSIIPSSDYIVPSPRSSPSKMHIPGFPSPNVLAAYYHHDHIPPPSPAPMGPLPTLPSSGGGLNGNSGGSAGQFPSAAQLRQRMTVMRQSVQQDYGIGLSAQRGRESSRPVLSTSQSTGVNGSVSAGGSSLETRVQEIRRYHNLGDGRVGLSGDDPAKYQDEEIVGEAGRPRVAADRQSWIDINEDLSLGKRGRLDQEAEEPDDLYEILDRFEVRSDKSGDSSSGGRAVERSHSFEADNIEQEQRHHPDSFDARPRQNNKVPADVARDVSGFEDDGRTVGDRTSRWSGSVYSNASILDEDESEETRDRFVRGVEAMLHAERITKSKALGDQARIPPLPKMPDAYANITHKPNGNINENASAHSNLTPGRSWNKF
ncbi:hypothetical protein BYT27DRAFT_7253035 [Phlegmacium glaucopus]|nr:hypothetical protein BYT27DRAFT_7253035 [Phlegmacium glaucopus]